MRIATGKSYRRRDGRGPVKIMGRARNLDGSLNKVVDGQPVFWTLGGDHYTETGQLVSFSPERGDYSFPSTHRATLTEEM